MIAARCKPIDGVCVFFKQSFLNVKTKVIGLCIRVVRADVGQRELVDNAIDSGADRIFINIEKAGSRLIQVTDNGSGMDQDDAPAGS